MNIYDEPHPPQTPFIRRAICKCGGELTFIGMVMCSAPAKFQHICKACWNVQALDKEYPHTAYPTTDTPSAHQTHTIGQDPGSSG